MDQITISIPDGIDADQKAAMTKWLSKQAEQMTPERFPIEDDEAWQDALAVDIRKAMAECEAGQGMTSDEFRTQTTQHLADEASRRGLERSE